MSLLWLLLRVRWRRALLPSLATAVLIGVIGGFVLASAAAARRVETAYDRFVDAIDAPDVAVIPDESCGPVNGTGCSRPPTFPTAAEVVEDLEAKPAVEKVRLIESVIPYITDIRNRAIFGTVDNSSACYDGDQAVQMFATQPGGPADQVVPFSLDGELPTPGSRTVVFTRSLAERAGLAIGDLVFLGGRCTGDGDPVKLTEPIPLRISGLSIGPLDVEAPESVLIIQPAGVDPEVFDALVAFGAEPQENVTVWLDPASTAEEVEESLQEYLVIIDFRERKIVFNNALTTDANLLWLLAAVGAVAGLLVVTPVVARNIRDTGPSAATLSALGAQRPQLTHHALAHGVSLASIGGLLASLVAIPVSAFMPRGLAAVIEPHRKYWFDGVVAGLGLAAILTVIIVIAALPAWNSGRAERRTATEPVERVALNVLNLRPAARSGVSAAVGSSVGPRRASPWPSVLSMITAAIVGVASLTYLAGLRHLQKTPEVVGWNWDAIVSFDFFDEDDEAARVALGAVRALDVVEASTEGTFYPPWFLYVPGTEVSVWPWSLATGPDAVEPSLLSGRAPAGPDEITIDAQFARDVGVGIGDTVTLARATLIALVAEQLTSTLVDMGLDVELPPVPGGTVPSAEFEITGIAVLPADRTQELAEVTLTLDGYSSLVEPPVEEIAATRAWLPDDLPEELIADVEELLANLDIGGRTLYVRFHGDVLEGANAVLALGVPEVVAPSPSQVLDLIAGLNVERNDRVPIALATTVAVAYLALAAYLLAFSVRSRRFEVAVMRAVGLSTAGVHRSVAAQATTTALVAVVVAVPVGVVAGRWAWLEYARGLGVQQIAVLPWLHLAWVALGAIVIANVVAFVPGWMVARRSLSSDLRSE